MYIINKIKAWIRNRVVERHTTIASIIRMLLSRNQDKTALVQGERRLTYKELAGEVYGTAAWLADQKINPGDRIALILPDSIEYIVMRLACWLTGIETVLLMDSVSQAHFDNMAENARPCAAVVPETADIDFGNMKMLHYSLVNNNEKIPDIAMPEEDKTASINYSSGSTGLPKGIQLTQKSWAASCHAFVRAAGSSAKKEQDTYLSVIPMAVAGSTSIIPVLLGGMRIVIAGTHEPAGLAELIEKEHVSLLFLTPVWLAHLTDHIRGSHTDISSLRKIAVGTDTVHAALMKRALSLFGPVITCSYGMAEVLPPLTILDENDYKKDGVLQEDLLHSVGKPYPHVTIDITDQDGNILKPGSQGNIRILSPSSAQGYVGAPEKERSRFRNGMFHSEDIGYFDEAGYLYILGREGHRIQIPGHDEVCARKVEDICFEQDSIISVCAVSLKDSIGIVYQLSKECSKENSEEIEKACRKNIGIPAVFRRVEAIPLTSAGKLDRAEAQKLFQK
ncbi:class I adenylate-forming enzyme family protein [Planctomycetota bacterium]